MKELSIKQKAKLYDEAYKRVAVRFGSNVADEIFSELEESEDEKIRKWLIALIKSNEYGSISNVGEMPCSKLNVLDWLEKQGKNNMGISEATKKKLEDNLNKALEKETPESWNKFLDEQGEQKPWSEEDDFMATAVENSFYLHCGQMTDRLSEQYKKFFKKVKSLRDRYTWKPSDKHMLAINTAINVLGKGTINGKYLIELQEQLKKLME